MRESSGVCSMVSFIMLEVRAAFRRTTATLLSSEAREEAALLVKAADLTAVSLYTMHDGM